jgi:RNA polymerase sigma-70 factor (ECF subfamily)
VNNQKDDHAVDKELVEAALAGDRYAFGMIVRNTEKLVASIVYRMISFPADRKDIAQDVYLKAYHDLAGFRFQSKLSTWIGKIAYYTCLKYLEKKKVVLLEAYDTEASASVNENEKLLFKRETSAIIQKEIELLPPVYKTLISLYHQEELSYAEIGQITGLPDGTVKSYLSRARKTLKENLLLNYKREEL